eukprot:SAG11_NODE_36858_length_259_cov_1.275000_1_plen_38_part_10
MRVKHFRLSLARVDRATPLGCVELSQAEASHTDWNLGM